MQVRVLFFGILKDLTGQDRDLLDLPEGALLADVVHHYQQRFPQLGQWTSSLAMAINQEYASPASALKPGDEIAMLPPVSGGSEALAPSSDIGGQIALVSGTINTAEVVARMKQPPDGATVVFEGIVRDNSRGLRTLFLDYEAYPEMALAQLQELGRRALGQFTIRDVAIVHRLGRLEIGETSVLIVVASAHRGPAFDACRWLIDTLKRTVPIWKKEYFADGAVWADGEPFPAEIPRAQGSQAEGGASK